MNKKKILFIGGSLNQTSMMHKISINLDRQYDCYFTPYYTDGHLERMRTNGMLDFTILGGAFVHQTINYLAQNNLRIDYKGQSNNYDLIFTCSDLIVQENIKDKKVILVQEGMTDPETLLFYLVKWLGLPRYLAGTSTTGLSDAYTYFCVASEGYKDLFIKKGVDSDKLIVTGIPNFDNAEQYRENEFPHHNYVLVATSDTRETKRYENRKKFILNAVEISQGRQIIFKLHPNENVERATAEINKYAPGALVYSSGNVHHMIANCEVLITKYSTVVYTGIALGKEVYSDFDVDTLKRMTPIQNNGLSAKRIAQIGINLIENGDIVQSREWNEQPKLRKAYSH
ncbi:MAG: hypothetical protein V1720_19445 [bacterium]